MYVLMRRAGVDRSGGCAKNLIETVFFDAPGKEFFRHGDFYAKEEIRSTWEELGLDFSPWKCWSGRWTMSAYSCLPAAIGAAADPAALLGRMRPRVRGMPGIHAKKAPADLQYLPALLPPGRGGARYRPGDRRERGQALLAGEDLREVPRLPRTFYGPDRRDRNHCGILEAMGYDDKPMEPSRPVLTK